MEQENGEGFHENCNGGRGFNLSQAQNMNLNQVQEYIRHLQLVELELKKKQNINDSLLSSENTTTTINFQDDDGKEQINNHNHFVNNNHNELEYQKKQIISVTAKNNNYNNNMDKGMESRTSPSSQSPAEEEDGQSVLEEEKTIKISNNENNTLIVDFEALEIIDINHFFEATTEYNWILRSKDVDYEVEIDFELEYAQILDISFLKIRNSLKNDVKTAINDEKLKHILSLQKQQSEDRASIEKSLIKSPELPLIRFPDELSPIKHPNFDSRTYTRGKKMKGFEGRELNKCHQWDSDLYSNNDSLNNSPSVYYTPSSNIYENNNEDFLEDDEQFLSAECNNSFQPSPTRESRKVSRNQSYIIHRNPSSEIPPSTLPSDIDFSANEKRFTKEEKYDFNRTFTRRKGATQLDDNSFSSPTDSNNSVEEKVLSHNISVDEIQNLAKLQEEALRESARSRTLTRRNTQTIRNLPHIEARDASPSNHSSNETYFVQSTSRSPSNSGLSSPLEAAQSYDHIPSASVGRSMPNLFAPTNQRYGCLPAPVNKFSSLQKRPYHVSDPKFSSLHPRGITPSKGLSVYQPTPNVASTNNIYATYKKHSRGEQKTVAGSCGSINSQENGTKSYEYGVRSSRMSSARYLPQQQILPSKQSFPRSSRSSLPSAGPQQFEDHHSQNNRVEPEPNKRRYSSIPSRTSVSSNLPQPSSRSKMGSKW